MRARSAQQDQTTACNGRCATRLHAAPRQPAPAPPPPYPTRSLREMFSALTLVEKTLTAAMAAQEQEERDLGTCKCKRTNLASLARCRDVPQML